MYTPRTWVDVPAGTTPPAGALATSAANFNYMEAGIALAGGRGVLYVAAVDAPTAERDRADYVCDGVADDVQIQAAINAAGTAGAGVVLLSTGTFTLAAEIALLGANLVDTESWVSLEGAGPARTKLVAASGLTAAIQLAAVWKGRLARFSVQVVGATHGVRAVATNTAAAGYRSFWGTTVEDIKVDGPGNGTHTGWALHLESPFRSTFRNIEAVGIGNGIRLFSSHNSFNPGDCVFTRCFMDSTGNTRTTYSVESTVASGNMNQVVFIMCEAICSGTGCTGIYLGGSGGTPGPVNHTEWIGTNLENFDTVVNIDRGEGNDISLNYVETRYITGMTVVKFGASAYNNTIRRIGMLYTAFTVTLVNDGNTALPEEPNTVENVKVYADTGSTINVTRNGALTTVLRDIIGDGPGTFAAGVRRPGHLFLPNATVTLTYGAGLTPDALAGSVRVCTMTGDATLNVPTNGIDQQQLRLRFIASGAQRTLTFNASLRRAGSLASTLVIPSGSRGDVGLLNEVGFGWTVSTATVA